MKFFCVLLLALLANRAEAEVLELAGGFSYCYAAPGARYEWREAGIVPLEGLFSYYSGAQRPLLPALRIPDRIDSGGVADCLVALPEKLDALEAELLEVNPAEDAEGAPVLKAQGFLLQGETGRELWCVFIGLESDLAPGAYTLRLEGSRGDRRFMLLAPFEVGEKSFGFEALDLTKKLGELLTEDLERRREEAARLRELLLSFRPQAVFHQGGFISPLRESIPTAFYGDRREYRFADGGKAASIHNGIDLAAPAGTEVLACGAGRVVLAADRLVSGNTVVIEHLPGVYSLYFHLQEVRVREGEEVRQGGVLGTVGSSGLATGAHLHWELRVSGAAVDPEYYLEQPLIDKSAISSIMEKISTCERR
jgi:hypothetical protein